MASWVFLVGRVDLFLNRRHPYQNNKHKKQDNTRCPKPVNGIDSYGPAGNHRCKKATQPNKDTAAVQGDKRPQKGHRREQTYQNTHHQGHHRQPKSQQREQQGNTHHAHQGSVKGLDFFALSLPKRYRGFCFRRLYRRR